MPLTFTDYSESLKFLGSPLAFFQDHALFTPQNALLLDPAFDRLTVELETTSYQDWSCLWGMLGAKHMPGVIYKIKVMATQDGVVLGSTLAVTSGGGETSHTLPTPVPTR